jgi:hypothetical protein
MAASRDETVKVMVRIRPMNSTEKAKGRLIILSFLTVSECRLQVDYFDGCGDSFHRCQARH